MHRFRLTVIVLAGLAALSLVAAQAPADSSCRQIRGAETPRDTSDDVEVCRQQVWIHQADTKVGNLAGSGSVTGGEDADSVPSWNTEEPQTSAMNGSGATYATVRVADIVQPENEAWRPTFQGTFTGDIDTLKAEMFLSAPIYGGTGNDYPLLYSLTIDGIPVAERSGEEFNVAIENTGQRGVSKITFALTGIYDVMESLGDFIDRGPDAEHTVKLTLINRYWGDGHTAFYYDATEVPSNLTFNVDPADLGFAVPTEDVSPDS